MTLDDKKWGHLNVGVVGGVIVQLIPVQLGAPCFGHLNFQRINYASKLQLISLYCTRVSR